MTIKQLPEVVNGRVKASVEKVDASLIDLAPTGNALVATTEGLKVDLSSYATTTDVSNAIAAAQLANGEVDLSGYATKAELAAYPKTVDVLTSLGEQAEGLESQIALKADVSALSAYATKADLEDYSRFEDVSTALFGMESVLNERVANLVSTTTLEEAIEGVNTSIPSLIDTKMAALVDGAPSTFDTLREIADWIETDGVTATELASSVAGKADRTELDEFRNEAEINTLIETYVMETYNPQLGQNMVLLLNEKVDKVEGKGLSTNDFTAIYKAQLDGLDAEFTTLETSVEGVRTELLGEVTSKLDTPLPTPVANTTPALENSLPLYTLKNNGEYVLCTPDTWFLINGFYVPGYSAATLGVTAP